MLRFIPLSRRWQGSSATLLLAAVLASTSTAAQAPQLEPLTYACFQLQLGQWSNPFSSGMPSLHIPPTVIRFDTAEVHFPRVSSTRRYRLQPNIAAIEASRRPWDPAWARTAPDSVRLVWTTGFAGVMLDLAVRGDSLLGLATARHDVVGPPVPKAHVVGWRVTCPPGLARRD